jgi:hypothetical protein
VHEQTALEQEQRHSREHEQGVGQQRARRCGCGVGRARESDFCYSFGTEFLMVLKFDFAVQNRLTRKWVVVGRYALECAGGKAVLKGVGVG